MGESRNDRLTLWKVVTAVIVAALPAGFVWCLGCYRPIGFPEVGLYEWKWPQWWFRWVSMSALSIGPFLLILYWMLWAGRGRLRVLYWVGWGIIAADIALTFGVLARAVWTSRDRPPLTPEQRMKYHQWEEDWDRRRY